MKKRGIIIAALALLLLPVFVGVGIAGAQRFTANVGEDEVVDSSIYSAGRSVEIRGTVNGDVFCAGQNVRIDATVNGDIICAAQNITIRGKVDGNIRVAGQVVNIDAEVTRSLTVAAQTFSLDADATVGRDATIMGQSTNIKGTVERDVLVQGNKVTLNGQVGRNVEATSEEVVLRDNAMIAGSLKYTSDSEATIAAGAQVAGDVTHELPSLAEDRHLWGIGIGAYLYFMAATLLFALLVSLLFPQAVRKTGEIARTRVGMSLLAGFVATFAIPIVAFAFAVTFVGMPLALIVLLLWALLVAASGPVAGYALGRALLPKRAKHAALLIVVGMAVLLTMYFLPYVGFFIALAAYWIGSGAIFLAIRKYLPKPVYRG